MNTLTTLVVTLLLSPTALAGSALVTNPHLPYPAGCGRMPNLDTPGGIESQATEFAKVDLGLPAYPADAPTLMTRTVPMTVRAYRAPCSEPERSLIWLEFALASQSAIENLKIPLPFVEMKTAAAEWYKAAALATEPNGWTSVWLGWDREQPFLVTRPQGLQWYYGVPTGDRRWVFLLDNLSPMDEWQHYTNHVTVDEYNGAFELKLHYGYGDDGSIIEVPAIHDVLPGEAPRLPLSGRLSGNWVVPDAADQGVLLSISERVLPDPPDAINGPERPMVVFLAHYTYDAAGDLLWLTGAAQIEPGETEVTIPIELVTDGQFRGSRQAKRAVVGSVTLKSVGCNRLDFDYDYSGVGLGAGEMQMQRLFSLEIAGHECRDFEARWAAMQ